MVQFKAQLSKTYSNKEGTQREKEQKERVRKKI